MHYTQCTFHRQLEGNATSRYVAFIPSSQAVLGKIVSLKFGDEWIHDWKIVEKGVTQDAATVERKSRDYLNNFWSIDPR